MKKHDFNRAKSAKIMCFANILPLFIMQTQSFFGDSKQAELKCHVQEKISRWHRASSQQLRLTKLELPDSRA